MGLTWKRTLTHQEVADLVRSSDTSGVPRNELGSFRVADLIVECADTGGETCYAAVEVSYTVNGRDTTRAVRNAGYLERFTGRPARAVIAGDRMDERVRESASGPCLLGIESTRSARHSGGISRLRRRKGPPTGRRQSWSGFAAASQWGEIALTQTGKQTAMSAMPADFALDRLEDDRLSVVDPIAVKSMTEAGQFVLEAPEINEFGYGDTLPEALADLQAAIAEL